MYKYRYNIYILCTLLVALLIFYYIIVYIVCSSVLYNYTIVVDEDIILCVITFFIKNKNKVKTTMWVHPLISMSIFSKITRHFFNYYRMSILKFHKTAYYNKFQRNI